MLRILGAPFKDMVAMGNCMWAIGTISVEMSLLIDLSESFGFYEIIAVSHVLFFNKIVDRE